ncbi:hypothetical protein [Treponema sp. R80B11-R83G3]
MKKRKVFFIGVLMLITLNTVFAAQEPDGFQGFIKPVLLKIIPLIKPNTLLATGPIEFHIDPSNVLFTEFGDKKYSAAFVERALTLSIMMYEGAFIQANSSIIVLNLVKSVLPVLNDMKIDPNSFVSDETGYVMLDRMGVETLLLAKLIEKNGKWIFMLSAGDVDLESDPLDREAVIRMIRKSVEEMEKKDDKIPVPRPEKEPQPNQQATAPSPIIDKTSKLSFRTPEIRPAKQGVVVADGIYVSAYDYANNNASASTRPTMIVFTKNNVKRIINEGHTDSINGIIPSTGVFFSYADDGLVIGYSSSDFKEQYRFNNGRPVKTAVLTTDGYIVTNPGNMGSKIFDINTRAERKEPLLNYDEVKDLKFKERIEIRHGLVSVIDSANKEIAQMGFYLDGQYGLIFNDRTNYLGSETIERHLNVTDYGKSERLWTPTDRNMKKIDNAV